MSQRVGRTHTHTSPVCSNVFQLYNPSLICLVVALDLLGRGDGVRHIVVLQEGYNLHLYVVPRLLLLVFLSAPYRRDSTPLFDTPCSCSEKVRDGIPFIDGDADLTGMCNGVCKRKCVFGECECLKLERETQKAK